MLWSCKTMLDWNHWHACLVVCVKKKNWVKEGWQGDNYMESEHSSWETLSLSREGGRLRLFIFHLEMEAEEQRGDPPVELLTGDIPSQGYSLSLLPLSPTPAHFPSPTFLIFTRELPLSLWEKGEEKKKKGNCSFSMPSFPASQSNYSSHTPVVCRALLGFALEAQGKLSWVVLKAPPRFVSLYVGSIASYPSPPH